MTERTLIDTLDNVSPLQALMDDMPLPPGEPIKGKTYIADGYVYRDLPNMATFMLTELIDILGREEVVWLTRMTRGRYSRGQALISPKGIQNLREYRERNPR